jgi:hypothetical protein
MPAFRNQDVVQNLIRAEADANSTTILTGENAVVWNKACDKVYGDMVADGLLQSAEQVKTYKIVI